LHVCHKIARRPLFWAGAGIGQGFKSTRDRSWTRSARTRRLGAEGIVSKRRDAPYRSGRTRAWLKVKNPKSPAVMRIEDGTW